MPESEYTRALSCPVPSASTHALPFHSYTRAWPALDPFPLARVDVQNRLAGVQLAAVDPQEGQPSGEGIGEGGSFLVSATRLGGRHGYDEAGAVAPLGGAVSGFTKAVKRGTGELGGAVIEEVNYEGYGPGGVAIFLECVTDNTNRTVAEIRHIMSKGGGNLGQNGSVAWMFERKGVVVIPADQTDEESLMELALEAGADDVSRDGASNSVIVGGGDVRRQNVYRLRR